ncbi:hypothetical protein FYK55_00435 [Roseiconus nitratireducens]|uniref:Uncharacterized protein n=1 Tax=Roseiconus nitratireducens TaxID=2605748 RepID=A0A5M6DH95_9BACT|nr:hypothetical protein [Roseiconus nitratireducens]KAA5546927.1 hypothetical protein FYK55_00435 [Roseiconus nitratireducens]
MTPRFAITIKRDTQVPRTPLQVCILFALVTILMSERVATCQDDRDTISQIAKVWKKRSDAVRTIRVAWVETSSRDRSKTASVGRVVWTLGQGGKSRLERIGRDSTGSKTVSGKTISSFDGHKNYSFTSESLGGDWPRGIVWTDKHNDHIHNIQIRPWLIHLRPFGEPVPGITTEGLRLREGNANEDDREHLIVRTLAGPGEVVGEYWLDPERDYVVEKYVELANGRATMTLKIEYEKDTTIGWIPHSWKGSFENGSFSISGRTERYELNPEIADSDFDIDFKEGTMVFLRDDGVRALYGPNGRRRIITPEESAAGFSYEELLSELTGGAGD